MRMIGAPSVSYMIMFVLAIANIIKAPSSQLLSAACCGLSAHVPFASPSCSLCPKSEATASMLSTDLCHAMLSVPEHLTNKRMRRSWSRILRRRTRANSSEDEHVQEGGEVLGKEGA
jgi:hypothetical protein